MRILVLRTPTVLLALLSLSGCTDGNSHAASSQSVTLLAAASTGNAMDEIVDQFRRHHTATVHTNYGGTSTLAQQVVHGAPADVFVSANQSWADYLQEQDLVVQRRELLANRLVLIVPVDSPAKIHGPQDLLAGEVRHLALADPDAVPAGVYAKQALSALGIWEPLKAKIVAGADVCQALTYVETASAEAGIVYATDAAASNAVRVVAQMAPIRTEPIRYPVMLLKHGAANEAAKSFYAHLNSPEAARVFRKHGFSVLSQPSE